MNVDNDLCAARIQAETSAKHWARQVNQWQHKHLNESALETEQEEQMKAEVRLACRIRRAPNIGLQKWQRQAFTDTERVHIAGQELCTETGQPFQ